MFINLEWSAFGNSGSGHVQNSELGTTFGGHSELGAFGPGVQSGRKNQPACFKTYELKLTRTRIIYQNKTEHNTKSATNCSTQPCKVQGLRHYLPLVNPTITQIVCERGQQPTAHKSLSFCIYHRYIRKQNKTPQNWKSVGSFKWQISTKPYFGRFNTLKFSATSQPINH